MAPPTEPAYTKAGTVNGNVNSPPPTGVQLSSICFKKERILNFAGVVKMPFYLRRRRRGTKK
jgi:hypothetical protein